MNNNWIKTSEQLPQEDGEYLVVITTLDGQLKFTEICNYDSKHKEFSCWDCYNDDVCIYKRKDILCWMKIPDYKSE